MQPTMTAQQASLRVADYAQRAFAALPPPAALVKWAGDNNNPCDDPTDNGPQGRVVPYAEYKITGLPPDQYNHYFDVLRQWWASHGFRVLADDRPKDLYLWVENNGDGFRMALQANDVGPLYLTSTAPCVWPNGTPEPSPTS